MRSRQDIDTDTGLIRVRQAFTEVRGAGLLLGPPKSRAGLRSVSVPASILPAVRQHLVDFVGEEPSAVVFTGPTGSPIWRGNFNKLVRWTEKVESIGMPGLHFHDLRHTGNTLAARTGASTKELMARMGHDSAEAAMIYQHATSEADRAIAKAVDDAMKKARKATKKADARKRRDPDDGAAGVMARRS